MIRTGKTSVSVMSDGRAGVWFNSVLVCYIDDIVDVRNYHNGLDITYNIHDSLVLVKLTVVAETTFCEIYVNAKLVHDYGSLNASATRDEFTSILNNWRKNGVDI